MIMCYNCKVTKEEKEYHWKKKGEVRRRMCKACVSSYDKQYREKNKDRLSEIRGVYLEKNKEKIAIKKHQYYKKNKELIKKKNEEYRKNELEFCIYALKLVKENKYYVGETIRYNQRIRGHKSALKTGKHANRKLQEYHDQYGWDAIEAVKLECFPNNVNKLVRLKAEIKWIEKYLFNDEEVINAY